MGWKATHRWLGLTIGTLALVLGVSGAFLAFDPVQQAWQAPAAPGDMSVATLATNVMRIVPAAQEIRRLPSGAIVVFSFAGDQAQATYVDPANGTVLGPWQPSALPRWVKNVHRSLLLGDAGRWGAAGIALGMGLLSVSGLVLLLRRMGGWRRLTSRVRGSLMQRIHVLFGRVVLVVLTLISLTALTMSASTLGLVSLDTGTEPEVLSVVSGQAALPVAQLSMLQSLSAQDLRRLNFPATGDPQDTWKVVTGQGEGWIDSYSGQTLAWQKNTGAQWIYDWALTLHTGEAAWPWAVVLGLVGACVLLFWLSGVVMWWQTRRQAPHVTGNSRLAQSDVLIFVASESGSTWGFAQTLHDALMQSGHRVHTSALEHFETTPATRQVFVLAATYGDGQAPAHASEAIARIAKLSPGAAPVTVVGFGDRQFGAFCAYAEALELTFRTRGWPKLMPLERVHQQSSQQFARWGEALAQVLGESLALNHVPRVPPTTALSLVSRQDFAGHPESNVQISAILRFSWPAPTWGERMRGLGFPRFAAGDLLGVVPPGSAVPRYYSLASGREDGFVEICVSHRPGGLCSPHLLNLQPGDRIAAFIRANPGFVLPSTRRPVLLVGAGTGVAPLAGFIRDNERHIPMHLYFGGRDPARDFYFACEIQHWLGEGRLATVHTAFSRVQDGGGYVQDAVLRDGERLRKLVKQGAILRVCGGQAMAQGVADALDTVLAPLKLTVQQLKAEERYAEDIF